VALLSAMYVDLGGEWSGVCAPRGVGDGGWEKGKSQKGPTAAVQACTGEGCVCVAKLRPDPYPYPHPQP